MPDSTIIVAPVSHSFGVHIKGSTTTQVVRVSNGAADATLILGTITAPSPFGIAGVSISDATIAPLAYADMTVAYIPSILSLGDASVLNIPSNDPITPTYAFNMDGSCEQAIIGVSPVFKSFGNHLRGTTTDQAISVTNTGNIDLHITADTFISPFWMVGSLAATIVPGATYSDATVSYRPTALNSGINDTLTISSDDPVTPAVTFIVDGTCEEAILNVIPGSWSYGTHIKSSSTPKVVRAANIGNINLTIGTVTALTPFAISGQSLSDATIAAGAWLDTTVVYIPSVLSTGDTSNLTIPSNDATTPYVMRLDGTCAQPIVSVSPGSWSFGGKSTDTTTDKTVTVSNTGNQPLIITTLSGLAAPFAMTGNNVTGKTLFNTGDSSTVVVRYTPHDGDGTSVDTLLIPSNDPVTATYSLVFDGTEVSADIDVSPSPCGVGATTPLSTVSKTVTVTNIGNTALIMTTVTSNNAQFYLANDNVSNAYISVGDSSTADVVFYPWNIGSQSAIITFNSNDNDTTAFPLTVTGTGLYRTEHPFRQGTMINAVTKSDTTAQLFQDQAGVWDYCQAFTVGASGVLKVTAVDASSGDVSLTVVAGTHYPYSIRRFWSTGTDSTVTVFAIK
jgi:hypothetical protein